MKDAKDQVVRSMDCAFGENVILPGYSLDDEHVA